MIVRDANGIEIRVGDLILAEADHDGGRVLALEPADVDYSDAAGRAVATGPWVIVTHDHGRSAERYVASPTTPTSGYDDCTTDQLVVEATGALADVRHPLEHRSDRELRLAAQSPDDGRALAAYYELRARGLDHAASSSYGSRVIRVDPEVKEVLDAARAEHGDRNYSDTIRRMMPPSDVAGAVDEASGAVFSDADPGL